jgi:Domain of unknown function (DUF5666)
MKTTLTVLAATASLAAAGLATTAAVAAPTAAVSAASVRHAEGRVTAIDRSARTFTVRDAQRGTLKVKVTASTKFERITFSSIRVNSKVDVRAVKSGATWRATKVERATALGNHDRNDDGPNHDAGDDHGGGRHGGDDDPAGHR